MTTLFQSGIREPCMDRRAYLSGLSATLMGGLAGCAGGVFGQQCHSGHYGPPKGLELNNHATTERTVTIEATNVSRDSSDSAFSTTTTLSAGESRTYEEVATTSGEYRVRVETASVSEEYTDTTETCGIWLFLIGVYDDRIERRQPGTA